MEKPSWWLKLKEQEEKLEERKRPEVQEKIKQERTLRKIAKKEQKDIRRQRSIERGKIRNVKPKQIKTKQVIDTPLIGYPMKSDALYIGPYYEIPTFGIRSEYMKPFPYYPEDPNEPIGMIIRLEKDTPTYLLKSGKEEELEARSRIKRLERYIEHLERNIENKLVEIDKSIERSGYYENLETIKRDRIERKQVKKMAKEERKRKSIERGKIR